MSELGPGLYEHLITEGLKLQLDELGDRLPSRQRGLDAAEAPNRIALHLSRQIEGALADVSEGDRVEIGLNVARALLGGLGELVDVDPSMIPIAPASVLHAVLRKRPDGQPEEIDEPLIPLLDTTLLTNAPGEPSLWNQLRSEIESADAIDVVMAFIRRSGIGPLLDALRRHCEAGRPLRVLTTTYTGSTERRALEQLADLGADVRISYDLTRPDCTPRPGCSTGAQGSPRRTSARRTSRTPPRSPGSSGTSGRRRRATPTCSPSSRPFSTAIGSTATSFPTTRPSSRRSVGGPAASIGDRRSSSARSSCDRCPFQERLLELVELARQRGHHRNLLVAATGTGKTVMAALDYAPPAAAAPTVAPALRRPP